MSHLLHLDGIEPEGYAMWRLTCEHAPDDDGWHPMVETSPVGVVGTVLEREPECWLMTWWDAIGQELLGEFKGPIATFPIAVVPDGTWTFDDGGSIVPAPDRGSGGQPDIRRASK